MTDRIYTNPRTLTDLLTIISEACSYADAEAPACSLCGFSSVPGLTAEAGRVCEPCAMLRPRLAMRWNHGRVTIGETVVGEAVRHPSGRWHVSRGEWADSLDDALDVIGGWWR